MGVDAKKALADWKKAKPLLLTKTGVSEKLRELPEKAALSNLKKYEGVLDFLDKAAADAKIKAEKKAIACINDLRKQIETFLDKHKTERAAQSKAVTAAHTLGKAFILKVATTSTLDALAAYETTVGAAFKKVGIELVDSEVPSPQHDAIESVADGMYTAVKKMRVCKTPPSPGKQLQFDPEKEIKVAIKEYSVYLQKLPTIASTLAKE